MVGDGRKSDHWRKQWKKSFHLLDTVLLNSANVSQVNAVFGSGLAPMPGFGQSIEGIGARQIQFSLDFEF
jgi:hypothetical protein